MLRLLSIQLNNFGKHRYFCADLSASVTGIIGPNFSGKSTILEAVKFAVTGNLPGGHARKIRLGEKSAEVVLKFEAGGEIGVVRRRISERSSHRLEWNGEELTKAKDVNARMASLLGADREAVIDAIFVPQGSLASGGLFGAPAERMEFLQRLLGVSDLPKIGEQAKKIRLEIDSGVNREQVEAALVAAKEKVIEAGNMKNESEKALLSLDADQLPEAEKLVRLDWKRQELLSQANADSSRLAELRAEKETLTAKLGWSEQAMKNSLDVLTAVKNAEAAAAAEIRRNEILRRLADLQKVVNIASETEVKRPSDQARKALAVVPGRIRWLQQVINQEQQLAEKYKKDIDDGPDAGVLDALEQKVEEQTKQVRIFKAEIDRLQTALNAAKLCSSGECPTCGAPGFDQSAVCAAIEKNIENSLKNLKEAQALLKESSAHLFDLSKADRKAKESKIRLNECQEKLSELTKNLANEEATLPLLKAAADKELAEEEAFRQFETRCRQAEQAHNETMRLMQELNQLPKTSVMPPPGISLEEAEANFNKMKAAEETIKFLEARIDETQRNFETKIRAVENLEIECKKIVEANGVRVQACLKDPRELDEWIKEVGEARGMLAVAEKQEKAALQNLKAAEEAVKAIEAAATASKRLGIIEQAFSRDGIPLLYASKAFDALAVDTSARLAQMGAGFDVRQSDSEPAAFWFSTEDGWLHQSNMSGGQKVRLACAFLLAVRDAVLSNVGLLILDEPSQHLDEEGVESLCALLQASAESGIGQALVCDHHRGLFPAFRNVIELKG